MCAINESISATEMHNSVLPRLNDVPRSPHQHSSSNFTSGRSTPLISEIVASRVSRQALEAAVHTAHVDRLLFGNSPVTGNNATEEVTVSPKELENGENYNIENTNQAVASSENVSTKERTLQQESSVHDSFTSKEKNVEKDEKESEESLVISSSTDTSNYTSSRSSKFTVEVRTRRRNRPARIQSNQQDSTDSPSDSLTTSATSSGIADDESSHSLEITSEPVYEQPSD